MRISKIPEDKPKCNLLLTHIIKTKARNNFYREMAGPEHDSQLMKLLIIRRKSTVAIKFKENIQLVESEQINLEHYKVKVHDNFKTKRCEQKL